MSFCKKKQAPKGARYSADLLLMTVVAGYVDPRNRPLQRQLCAAMIDSVLVAASRQSAFRTLPGRNGPLQVDFFRQLRTLGKHDDFIALHFDETTVYRDRCRFLAGFRNHWSNLQRCDEWNMASQDAKLPFESADRQAVHLFRVHHMLRRNDFQ